MISTRHFLEFVPAAGGGGEQTIVPTGIASAQVFGAPNVAIAQFLAASGIVSGQAFGVVAVEARLNEYGSLSESMMLLDLNPEAATSVGDALMLVLVIQDVTPAGRRQPIKHGGSRVTWEEP